MALIADTNKPRPSVDGPVKVSMACSGCGIRPTMRPVSVVTPAIAVGEPVKLSVGRKTTGPAPAGLSRVAGAAGTRPSPCVAGPEISAPAASYVVQVGGSWSA